MDPESERLVGEYYRAFNERRFDTAHEFLDARAKLHHSPTGREFVGPDGYRTACQAWLAAFPDAQVDVVSISAFGQHGIQVDLVGRGTHEGPFELGPLGTLSPTGRSFTMNFRNVFAIEGGKIVESWLDFEMKQFAKQLTGE